MTEQPQSSEQIHKPKKQRKTSGGKLLLASPKGTLTLSGFSAGLLDGSVSVDRMEYDLVTKHTETVVQLNGIPIQSLLDQPGRLLAAGDFSTYSSLHLMVGAATNPSLISAGASVGSETLKATAALSRNIDLGTTSSIGVEVSW